MSQIVLRRCLRPSLLTRGLLARSLAGPRSHRYLRHKVTKRDRKVQVGMTNRPMAVSHHLKIVRHAMAGTPDDQSNRKGVVRQVAAVAMVVEAAPAPVRTRLSRMGKRMRSNSLLAPSGEAEGKRGRGGIRRKSSNALLCPNQADTEPGKMRSSRIPRPPQGGQTIRQFFGSSRHSTKQFLSRT